MIIKCFEAYHETPYYTELTAAAWSELSTRRERFTTNELVVLRDYLAAYDYFKVDNYLEGEYQSERGGIETVTFFKDHDEYYYVAYRQHAPDREPRFYRCDQWTGLLQWLEKYQIRK